VDTIQYTLGGGLSPEQLDRLHRAALTILDEIGVEVGNPALRKALAGQAGVRLQGTRVRLAPELVDRLVAEHRAALPPPQPPGNEFFLEILSGYAFDLIELDTGRTRPMTTADCVDLARLVDGLYDEGLRGGTPGLPQDAPAAVREVLAYKISLQHTRVPGWPGFTSQAGGDAVLRMAEIAGQPVGLSVFVRDPLLIEGPTVDMAVEFLRRKASMALGIGNMPMAGVLHGARRAGTPGCWALTRSSAWSSSWPTSS
jgi:trimethylamine:corrinoid methyltransferase-like protein